jgi:hypothetical protein
VIYTTNALESVHTRVRKIIKTGRHFPTDEAAIKLIWLVLRNITAERLKAAHHWRAALNQVAILARGSMLEGAGGECRFDSARLPTGASPETDERTAPKPTASAPNRPASAPKPTSASS